MAELKVLVKVGDLRRWIESMSDGVFKLEITEVSSTDGFRYSVDQVRVEVVDEAFRKVLKHLKISPVYSFEIGNRGDGYYEMDYDDLYRVLDDLRRWIIIVRRYHEKYLRRLAEFLKRVEDGEVEWGEVYEP